MILTKWYSPGDREGKEKIPSSRDDTWQIEASTVFNPFTGEVSHNVTSCKKIKQKINKHSKQQKKKYEAVSKEIVD